MKKISMLVATLALAGASSAALAENVTMTFLTADGLGKSAGTISLKDTKGGLQITPNLKGLPPGEHGFHVHEKGDCSSPDGLSAGGHFNPTGQAHGRFDSAAHHTGDLPSLRSDAQGMASIDFVSRGLALDQGPNSVVGRGLIVHKDPDDYTTQPTGNSGARLACAVITRG